MVKLNQLENALALKAHGNFYGAAKAQHISQPALSRSIQKLEESLGVLLFERLPDRVMPTEYGKIVLSRAKTIVSETEQLRREITMVQGLQTGHISIGMGVYAAEMSGNRAIAELVRLHPEVSCQSNVYLWRFVINQVLERSIDLGVAEISTLRKSDPKLAIEPLGQHSVVFFCRKGHPLLARKKLRKADLDAYPLAAVNIPPRVAKVFPGKPHISKETGDLAPFIEADSQTAARAIIERSNAFGAATPVQLEPWLESGRFEVLPYRKPWLKLDYGFIYLRNHRISPAVKLFMELARDIETELAQRNRELMKQVT